MPSPATEPIRVEIDSDAAWHKARRLGLGASEAGDVVGLGFHTNVWLWELKTGKREREDLSDVEAVKFGIRMEPVIRETFAAMNPQFDVEYRGRWDMVRDTAHGRPWYLATLDGRIRERDTGRKGVLECKTATIMSAESAERWKNRVPNGYLCQVYHQLNATDFDFAVIAAFIRDADERTGQRGSYREYWFERPEHEEGMKWLLGREIDFWGYVERNEQPPLVLPTEKH